MPDRHYEVLIVIIAGTIIFLVLTGITVFISMYYQKKKFLHRRQLDTLEKDYQEQLLRSQLEMQEQTFNTISREIHDNVGQLLSLAKVQLNIMDTGQVFNSALLHDVKDNIGKAMVDLRDIAKSLSTDRISDTAMTELAEHELQRIARTGMVGTRLFADGTEISMDEHKKLIILRIMQESFQNILKHAAAANISVLLCYEPAHFKMEIKDDGVGFDTAAVKGGAGLKNILSRAALMRGRGTITSTPGTGTTVTIILPYA